MHPSYMSLQEHLYLCVCACAQLLGVLLLISGNQLLFCYQVHSCRTCCVPEHTVPQQLHSDVYLLSKCVCSLVPGGCAKTSQTVGVTWLVTGWKLVGIILLFISNPIICFLSHNYFFMFGWSCVKGHCVNKERENPVIFLIRSFSGTQGSVCGCVPCFCSICCQEATLF